MADNFLPNEKVLIGDKSWKATIVRKSYRSCEEDGKDLYFVKFHGIDGEFEYCETCLRNENVPS